MLPVNEVIEREAEVDWGQELVASGWRRCRAAYELIKRSSMAKVAKEFSISRTTLSGLNSAWEKYGGKWPDLDVSFGLNAAHWHDGNEWIERAISNGWSASRMKSERASSSPPGRGSRNSDINDNGGGDGRVESLASRGALASSEVRRPVGAHAESSAPDTAHDVSNGSILVSGVANVEAGDQEVEPDSFESSECHFCAGKGIEGGCGVCGLPIPDAQPSVEPVPPPPPIEPSRMSQSKQARGLTESQILKDLRSAARSIGQVRKLDAPEYRDEVASLYESVNKAIRAAESIVGPGGGRA